MADEQNAENAAPAPSGKKKLVVFSGVGLAVIIGAAFMFATFAVPVPPEDAAKGAEQGDDPGAQMAGEGALEIYDLPTIMVNLRGTNKKRVLKIHLNVMYESDTPELASALFEQKLPEVKDMLTTLLTEKTLEQLEGKDDLNMLRMELMDEINRVVFAKTDGQVVKVYYEEFLVQ
ncbi:MAG: flagellar basal body-associated FliL family protein [Planctomycetota bacterium]|jgi:flagellar basal body-associated protein FliL